MGSDHSTNTDEQQDDSAEDDDDDEEEEDDGFFLATSRCSPGVSCLSLTPLERFCFLLQRDDVKECQISDYFTYDDTFAFAVAGSLMGNSSLERLGLIVGREMTEFGVKALSHAIRNSCIERLRIMDGTDDDHTGNGNDGERANESAGNSCNIVKMLFFDVLSTVQELVLDDFYWNNMDVIRLGSALRGAKMLGYLSINLRWVTDREAVHAMCLGILHLDNIYSLNFDGASPMVCALILSEGIITPELCYLFLTSNELHNKSSGTVCKEIDLKTTRKFDPDSLLPFVPAQLQFFLLKDCPLSQVTDQVMFPLIMSSVVRGNMHLRMLQLVQCGIGDDDVELLVEILKNDSPPWQDLCLHSNNIGTEGLYRLLNAVSSLPSCPLKNLTLSSNPNIGREIGLDVQHFERSDTKSGQQHQHSDMHSSLRLEILDLSACEIQVLPKGLLYYSHIKLLKLADNSIGNMGATVLVDTLNHRDGGGCLKVKNLGLDNNEIGVAGALKLVKASHAHVDWKGLKLNGNTVLEYEDLTAVAEQLADSKLSKLALHVLDPDYENGNDDTGVTQKKRDPIQVQAQKKIAYQALVDAMKGNIYLERLESVDVDDFAFKRQFDFYVDLNKKFERRCLLQNAEPALWPHVLAKKCGHDHVSVLFSWLQQKPTLMMPTVAKKKRPHGNNSKNWTTKSKRR